MENKILSKISLEQALQILKRLSGKDPNIARLIEEEAKQLFIKINVDDICEEVYAALDGLDVKELWDNSGASSFGYTAPEDMAVEMMEDELDTYNKDVVKYFELDMPDEAGLYCMGVLGGIYRYAQQSKSEFKDWAADVPEACFGHLLEEWKKRTKNKNDISAMNKFIEKECNNWAEWAFKK